MTAKRFFPEYDLGLVKSLVSSGRVSLTKKGTGWLRNHGYSPRKAIEFVFRWTRANMWKRFFPTVREGYPRMSIVAAIAMRRSMASSM